ncbi:MAG TPA: YciK family oxidoreductase [Spongiibacteraceae bacterium]|nr:YciK family oxidoreductase [Spongiibacteraceae bacterium]
MTSIKPATVASSYTAAPDLLKDRVILVTGAGDGIGRAAAIAFAAHGATVILLGKTIAKLEAVYDEIEDAGYPQPAIYPLKLGGATFEDYQTLAETIENEFGRLDGLLQNAGILGERKNILDTKPSDWNEVLNVNLTSNFLLTKALLPLLMKSEDASIVFTSSSVGRKGRAFWGAYAVSKFGVEGLAQILADELDTTTQIRVNCINPGPTNTAMRRMAYPAEHPAVNPFPEQIMPAYLYLMGADSKGITGKSFDAQNK